MPMYFLQLGDSDVFTDPDGTELADLAAARAHTIRVARELAFKRSKMAGQPWSAWTISAHDNKGTKLFSFPMTDFAEE